MSRFKFVLMALILVATVAVEYADGHAATPQMTAHFIDVGQGASALLEFPCGAILIDAGAQDDAHEDHLAEFLVRFFQRRPDLNNTLSTVIITHPHIDHTRALRRVTQVCRIRSFVDTGLLTGSGGHEVQWIRNQVAAGMLNTHVRAVSHTEVESLPSRTGLTDQHIDGISCPDCDPRIVVLSASHSANPGWTTDDFRDANNHSLVTRVDFGQTSLLFTGDLEVPAIEKLVGDYQTDLLDVDVYHVGHHGSHNGTTAALLAAATPRAAVMGVGRWDYGRGAGGNGYTTYDFGHPRRVTLDLLSSAISETRASAKQTRVFDGVRRSRAYTVTKNIYATGWDGDIAMTANLDGSLVFHVPTDTPIGPTPFAPSAASGSPLATPRPRSVPIPARITDGYSPPPPYDSVPDHLRGEPLDADRNDVDDLEGQLPWIRPRRGVVRRLLHR